MSASGTAPGASPPEGLDLASEARIARLHLRVGMLSLALAELEDLERRSELDVAGRAALAEARWRTGGLEEAGAAARAHLDAGGEDPVAIAIAAEAAGAEGRASEARALMDRLGSPDPAVLDALFAGMPRRGFWPSAASADLEGDTLFGHEAAPARERDSDRPRRLEPGALLPMDRDAATAGRRRPPELPDAPLRAVPGPREVFEATDASLWSVTPDASEAAPEGGGPAASSPSDAPSARVLRTLDADPVAELAQARRAMATDPDRAILRAALVLRMDPTLAPLVLDAISGRTELAAVLLKGDALRLLGRHLEAELAYAGAAGHLEPPPSSETDPDSRPPATLKEPS